MTKQYFGNISRLGRCTVGAAALAVSGTWVSADITDDPLLDDLMLTAHVVTKLVTECSNIDARPKRVAQLVENVQKHIETMGYTEADQAVLSSPEYVALIQANAADYMQANGSASDDANALCTFGQKEISERTAVGKHLRKN